MMQFVRRYAVRVVIGAVLAAMAYATLSIWMPYQREKRIASEIKAIGGAVSFQFKGPTWVPKVVRRWLPMWNQINGVGLTGTSVGIDSPKRIPASILAELQSLPNLTVLAIDDTQFGNSEVEQLKELNHLKFLSLFNTQITDVGLLQLKRHPNLSHLMVESTRTTAEGRAMLRNALPKCKITPDP